MPTVSVLPAVDSRLVARARRITGAKSDTEAINEALRRMVEPPNVTVDMLVDNGELLMLPKVPGHIITNQMVEDFLAEE